MTKLSKKKRKLEKKTNDVENQEELPPKIRRSDDPTPKKVKWINKQRVLIFASRGINYRHRHLMEDIKRLMPHHKPEPKMERTKNLAVINEMAEMKNCSKAVMFEGRRKKDLYMWISNIPIGPSVKFLVENIYTMAELKLTGNCLKASRPLLSFDKEFDVQPHYTLLKELIVQIFGVPNHHPKSQPFFDHVYSFTVLDNRIWFRNFQILSEDGALAEIGPRFVLNPIKIFSCSFTGAALWENPNYVTPTHARYLIKQKASEKYINRVQQKVKYKATKPKTSYNLNPLDDIFSGDPVEVAKKLDAEEKMKTKREMRPKKGKKKKFKIKNVK